MFFRFIIALLLVNSARGDVLELAPAADTALFEPQPDFNFGAQEDMPSGTLGSLASTLHSRVLFRFDLAANLAANATIRSAVLRLSVTRTPDGGGFNSAFALHRVLQPWGEGSKKGGPPGGSKATDGEATWNARFYPDQLWNKPGGEPGVDFEANLTSSERITGAGTYEFEFGQNQLAQLMDWLRHPETNFGWILISQAEDEPQSARRFASKENADQEMRPTLIIDYTAPAEFLPPRITNIALSDGTATIAFEARAAGRYRLEYSDTLPALSWQPVDDYIPLNFTGTTSFSDTTAGSPRRFYRIAAVP